MEMPIPNFCSWNRHGDSMSRSSEFWIPIEFRIPNFCPWNCHGNSMNRSSEFGIPLPFLTYLPKKVKMGCGIPNSELLLMELPWRFQGQKFGIRNSIGILNSELLLLESPWRFHEQKFGIGISMDRSLGPNSFFHCFFFSQFSFFKNSFKNSDPSCMNFSKNNPFENC